MSTNLMRMKGRGQAADLPGRIVGLAIVAALALTVSSCGRNAITAPTLPGAAVVRSSATTEGALHLQGVSETGALWVIDRPAGWNGDLVVYLHGYTDPAQPIALPNNGPVRDSLLARGFAVAASSFSSNGYAVAEGVRESHELSGIFQDQVGTPRRTFLLGRSLGGLIGMILVQKYPGKYDGSLLVSGIVGGSDDEVQYVGDIRVLFDAVYGPVLGGDLYHPPAITNMNQQVILPVMQAVQANPQGLAIIQALARRPLPGISPQEVTTSLIQVLVFGVQGGGDLFERCHEHSFFDNATWRYDSPLLPREVVEDINARVARYTREPDAAEFLLHWGEPAGPFSNPVLTIHTTRDPVVPAFHEELLAQVATGPMLRQHLIAGYGHNPFSAAEIMPYFCELVRWVDDPNPPIARLQRTS